MQKEDPSLRVEANSIPNDALSESQREAFKQIVHSLAETVRDLKTPNGAKDHQGTDGVDDDRKSRTVMISGDRGTGKTTLMLTLQNRITKDRTPIDEKEFGLDCKTQLEEIRGRIVWLEPLDMEHSSNTTNLFVSILARIDDAIKACFRDGYRENDPYGMSVSTIPGSDDVLMELRRLEVDASLAWEGNLVARAPSLDSDAYATEVMRAERARMKINPRFRDLLEKIATRLHWGPKISNPIFVLAVDDFDLNPSRCLDILKLIRSLNVPRLFTLVLGDEEVAEEVFRLDIQGVMSRIANVAIDARDGASSSFIKRIKHISPQAVRKLVPPHQRLKLKYNTVEQSLKIKPSHAKKSIEDLLKEFLLYTELPAGTGVSKESESPYLQYSLYDLLEKSIPDFMYSGKTYRMKLPKPLVNRYRYKGSRILETSIREVIDLWYSLNRILVSGIPKTLRGMNNRKKLLIEEIRKSVRRAVYDDAYLSLESAERFIYNFENDCESDVFKTSNLELILPLPMSHQMVSDNFPSENISKIAKVHMRYVEEFRLLYFDTDAANLNTKRLESRVGKSAFLSDHSDPLNIDLSEGNNISGKTQSHLILLHDLIATNPLAPILGNHLVKPVGEYGIAKCDWTVDSIGKISIPWRGAIFRTVRELEIFCNSWDMFLERARGYPFDQGSVSVDVAAKAWLILNLTTLLGDMRIEGSRDIEFVFEKDEDIQFSIIRRLMLRVLSLSESFENPGKSRAGWTLDGLFANFYAGSGFSLNLCEKVLSAPKLLDAYRKSISRIDAIRLLAFEGTDNSLKVFHDAFMVPTILWKYVGDIANRISNDPAQATLNDLAKKLSVGKDAVEEVLRFGTQCVHRVVGGDFRGLDTVVWKFFIHLIESSLLADPVLLNSVVLNQIAIVMEDRSQSFIDDVSSRIVTIEDMKQFLSIVMEDPYFIFYCSTFQSGMNKMLSVNRA